MQLRKLVNKIRSSHQRRERLKQQCTVLNIKPLQPISDVKTRWGSTFNMIERAMFLREVRIFNIFFINIIIIIFKLFTNIIYFISH